MIKTKIKNIIFDLDGTLIDSSYDVIRILKKVLKENGADVDEHTPIQIGPPLFDMVKNTVPHFDDEIAKKCVEEYRGIYESDPLDATVPFEGIIEILNSLKDRGIKVFIATYKPRNLAQATLDNYFEGLFLDIATPSEVSGTKKDILELLISKWDLEPQECIMVGDAGSDITCAHAVKMPAIGVLWGYGQNHELETADLTVKSVNELNNFIKEL